MFLELGKLLFFPAATTFNQDAFQQLRAGFQGFTAFGAFGPPLGSECAFYGCFQERLAVLRQLFLRGFEFGYASIEIGEKFFEFFNNPELFSERSN